LNAKSIDAATIETTMSILLKHETDLQRAKRWLQRPQGGGSAPRPSGDDNPARWRN
jgi:hypothetical protein